MCTIIIFISGQIAFHFFQLLLAIPVFYFGESTNLTGLAFSGEELNKIPYDGIPPYIRFAVTYIFPILISGVLSASVFLGKIDALNTTLSVILATIAISLICIFFWNKALKNYTSAPS